MHPVTTHAIVLALQNEGVNSNLITLLMGRGNGRITPYRDSRGVPGTLQIHIHVYKTNHNYIHKRNGTSSQNYETSSHIEW